MADPNFTNPFLFPDSSKPRREAGKNITQWHELELMDSNEEALINLPNHVNVDAIVSPKTIPRNGSLQSPATLNSKQDTLNRHCSAATRPATLGRFVFRMEDYVPKNRYDLTDFEAVPATTLDAIAVKYDHWLWINNNHRVTLPPWLFPVPKGHIFQVDRRRMAEQQNMAKMPVKISHSPYIPAGAMYIPLNRWETASLSPNPSQYTQPHSQHGLQGSQGILAYRLPSLEAETDVHALNDENFVDLLVDDD